MLSWTYQLCAARLSPFNIATGYTPGEERQPETDRDIETDHRGRPERSSRQGQIGSDRDLLLWPENCD